MSDWQLVSHSHQPNENIFSNHIHQLPLCFGMVLRFLYFFFDIDVIYFNHDNQNNHAMRYILYNVWVKLQNSSFKKFANSIFILNPTFLQIVSFCKKIKFIIKDGRKKFSHNWGEVFRVPTTASLNVSEFIKKHWNTNLEKTILKYTKNRFFLFSFFVLFLSIILT